MIINLTLLRTLYRKLSVFIQAKNGNTMNYKRRNFLKHSVMTGTGIILAPWLLNSCQTSSTNGNTESTENSTTSNSADLFFKISLAQWSLNRQFFKGEIDNLDFAKITKEEFGIEAVEYVNQFFKDKANDKAYLTDMKTRAEDLGVKSLIIMVDGEGGLGGLDDAKRKEAVENHYKWVEAAQFLGCHSIRVNAYGEGTAEEVSAAAIDGLGSLSTFAQDYGLNVIVENHGGYSSDGQWLANVISQVGLDNCGTLPDFGNFCIKRAKDGCEEEYDRYKGVAEMMPFAKAVSAKAQGFDAQGNEIYTDYTKMMKIVKDAGYTGYVGIEFEGGNEADPYEGIKQTKAILEKVGRELSAG